MIRFEPGHSRKVLTGQLAWFGLWLGVTVVALFLHADPSGHGTHTQLGLPPCPSMLVFDRPCPGCGLTTSWTATVHLQLGTAFRAHPLGPLLYLGFTGTALLALWGWFRGLYLDLSSRQFGRVATATLAVFLVFAAVRFATVPDAQPPAWRQLAQGR